MLDIDIIRDIQVGDIILVHGESTLADIIEDFQKIKSKLYGKWTHACIVCEHRGYSAKVSEADKLGICKTDVQKYLDSGKELLLLRYKIKDTSEYAEDFEEIADYYAGRTRYNVVGLLQQAWRFTKMLFDRHSDISIRNKKTRFMCGSWVAFNYLEVMDEALFDEYTKIAPVDFFDNDLFEIKILKQIK